MNSLLLVDGYKIGHHNMYQDGIEKVYSNFTPRSNRYAPEGNNGKVLNFGQQAVIKYIVNHFNNNFFSKPKDEVINEIKTEFSLYLGIDYDTTHFEKLHDLGYLPIKVKSLPEGTESAIRIPILTIVNTHNDFAWVTNYLETIISNLLWQPITSATTALIYKKTALEWVNKTDPANTGLVDWMLHDFSMRGLTGLDAAVISGAAYGEGIYHSAHTAKSLGYTGYDNDKIFFIQNVHMGKPYTYNGWYKDGKDISRNQMNYKDLKALGHDSLYVRPGDGLQNSEYIVYNKEQTITEYLLWLK